MVLKTPSTILELERLMIDSFYGERSFYSDRYAVDIWEACDKKTGYLDILLDSGEKVKGHVSLITFVPTRISGPPRVFVFDYVRKLKL